MRLDSHTVHGSGCVSCGNCRWARCDYPVSNHLREYRYLPGDHLVVVSIAGEAIDWMALSVTKETSVWKGRDGCTGRQRRRRHIRSCSLSCFQWWLTASAWSS